MIIAVCGQKGGSGKTTAATNIAAELVQRGRKILLVDADDQGSARTWGAKARARNGSPSPDITAGNDSMHKRLPSVAHEYFAVVIDCPGRVAPVQRSALLVADLAIIPCSSGAVDGWALAETVDEIQRTDEARARHHLPALRVRALVSHVDMRRSVGRQVYELIKAAGLTPFRAELLDRAEYEEAQYAGEGVTTWAPSSTAADEVRALVDEILKLGSKR